MNNILANQLDSLKQKKIIMAVLIFFFVAVITWTMVSLFTSQKKIAISPELRELSKPLTPVIKEDVFIILEKKRFYEDSELTGFPIYKVLTSKDGKESKLVDIEVDRDVLEVPTPTPSPVPSTTPSLIPLSQPASASASSSSSSATSL